MLMRWVSLDQAPMLTKQLCFFLNHAVCLVEAGLHRGLRVTKSSKALGELALQPWSLVKARGLLI